MLYLSTRNYVDSFTAYRTLRDDRTPDGGYFIPMSWPELSCDDLLRMRNESFGQTVASVLNRFFASDLSGWDIDSCAGRHPFKLLSIRHKMTIIQLWHNQLEDFQYFQSRIYQKLLAGNDGLDHPTLWAQICINIAVLCGVWSEAESLENVLDISLGLTEPSMTLAAYFAKKMGLPIGRIICSTIDDGTMWDLLGHGQMSVASGVSSVLVEHLIFDQFGLKETQRMLESWQYNKGYQLNLDEITCLRETFYASVIGSQRIKDLISSIQRSCGYTADQTIALAFGGLQNYRAQSGCSRTTVLLELRNPINADA